MRTWLPLLALGVLSACGSTSPDLTGGTTSGSGGAATSSGSSGTGTGSGGMTSSTGGAGASGGATGSGGGACTPWSDEGAACTQSMQCVMPSAVCSCTSGTLGCRSTVDFSMLPFNGPAKLPPNGACCNAEGMICGGYEDCGPVCTCVGGAWSCKPDVTCEPFACPTDIHDLLDLHDTACKGHIGLACSIGPACGGTFCTCMLDDETLEPSWHCATTPC